VDIAELSGKIDELKASIDGRFGMYERRVKDLELWKEESQEFHVEMRKRWDRFDGNMEAENRIQTERHKANAAKINLLILLVAVLAMLAAWATFIRPANAKGFLDFSTHVNDPMYADRQDSHLPYPYEVQK